MTKHASDWSHADLAKRVACDPTAHYALGAQPRQLSRRLGRLRLGAPPRGGLRAQLPRSFRGRLGHVTLTSPQRRRQPRLRLAPAGLRVLARRLRLRGLIWPGTPHPD